MTEALSSSPLTQFILARSTNDARAYHVTARYLSRKFVAVQKEPGEGCRWLKTSPVVERDGIGAEASAVPGLAYPEGHPESVEKLSGYATVVDPSWGMRPESSGLVPA